MLLPSANTRLAPVAGHPIISKGGVLAALLIANITAVSVHVRSWAEVQKRAGCLAVTHLVPLCSGFSFSLPAHVYRVERSTLQWAHRWLGRICALHCLLHGSVVGTALGIQDLQLPSSFRSWCVKRAREWQPPRFICDTLAGKVANVEQAVSSLLSILP